MLIHRVAMACCILLTVGLTTTAALAEESDEAEQVTQPELRDALLARFKVDQEVRFRMIKWARENGVSLGAKEVVLKRNVPVITEMKRVDQENRKWLESIIRKHGWPGKTLVGVNGSHAAWLLVQHADRDRPFQKRCLKLMQESAKGEVSGMDIAYLVDRVRVGEGKQQLYGTQTKQVDSRWTVQDVEDPDNLDRRRAKMGMPPIREYLDLVERMYSQQKKSGQNREVPPGKTPTR